MNKIIKQLKKLYSCEEAKVNDLVATNLGILLGVGLLGWAILSASQATRFFYNPSGLAIVLGGTFAATLISFPLREVLEVFNSFRLVFFSTSSEADYYNDTITDAVETSLLSYESEKAFHKVIEECSDQVDQELLMDGLTLVASGYEAEMIKESMDVGIENNNLREISRVKILRAMGDFSPTFGIIGTIIGLIQMMAVLKTDISNVGSGLAVAFTTTFYGALLANLIFHPMAEKLESRRIKNISHLNLIATATVLILNRHHPVYVEANLNSFLPPKERVDRFDGEKYIGQSRIKLKRPVRKKKKAKSVQEFEEDLF